jgi:hypothetical protein
MRKLLSGFFGIRKILEDLAPNLGTLYSRTASKHEIGDASTCAKNRQCNKVKNADRLLYVNTSRNRSEGSS